MLCIRKWFPEQVFVIPVLIGLVFELLVIVPMRVPVDESPVFLLYQDWPLGLIVLKIWSTLVSTLFFFVSHKEYVACHFFGGTNVACH